MDPWQLVWSSWGVLVAIVPAIAIVVAIAIVAAIAYSFVVHFDKYWKQVRYLFC